MCYFHLCSEINPFIQSKYQILAPQLNERQRRLWAASEANSIGWGGISLVSKSTGISRATISKGIKEIKSDLKLRQERIRKKGGGRKKAEYHDPSLRSDILEIVNPSSRGDPESPLRWCSKSLKNIANALKLKVPSRKVGVFIVRRILHEEGYSLQSNRKVLEGGNHPDRDKQFKFIANQTLRFINDGNPAISVDAKKKELIGNYKNNGQEWQPKGNPVSVEVYDFPSKDGIKATPYGVYDIATNQGYINIGVSADTAVFAAKSILKWWENEGKFRYSDATALLITADGGGSNGSRVRLWKVVLQQLSDRIGIPISMCHYPPGTSKWNKIEHRLFSAITMNWRGQPLTGLYHMKELISHTTNSKGLKVKCELDMSEYKRGIKISDKILSRLNLKMNEFHGEWNYTFFPRSEIKS